MSTEKFAHMDADESIFFSKQLSQVKSKTYDIQYAELKARKLIPVSKEINPGAEVILYEQFDSVGMAKVISSYADDLPRADIKGKEYTAKVKSLGAAYGYNLQEIRAAKFAGKPLQQRKADAAKRAILQKENSIAFFGDSANGLGGFINAANISTVTIPADGTGASSLWVNKTADLILRDMNLVANFPVENTKGVEVPDTLLLPIEQYNIAATKRIGVDSNMTVLKYFLETSPYIKQVEWVNELKDAGTSNAEVIMAYKRDPMKLTLEVPQDFEQLDVEQRNLEFVVPCHSRTAGVIVYYPLSICKGEGI